MQDSDWLGEIAWYFRPSHFVKSSLDLSLSPSNHLVMFFDQCFHQFYHLLMLPIITTTEKWNLLTGPSCCLADRREDSSKVIIMKMLKEGLHRALIHVKKHSKMKKVMKTLI